MRHKDVNWSLPAGTPGPNGSTHPVENIQVALLMDIRDELKDLNLKLQFNSDLIATLKRIDRRLAQTNPLRKRKTP